MYVEDIYPIQCIDSSDAISQGTEGEAMEYVRLRTDKNEIIIAPGDSCTLIVVQAGAEVDEEAEETAGPTDAAA